MNLQAMTREKLQFLLPVVFTVGPDVNQRGVDEDHEAHAAREDHGDALMKYAMLLSEAQNGKGQHIENIVKGIIEGETRVLVSKYQPNLQTPRTTIITPLRFNVNGGNISRAG
jgi:flotillin